MKEQVRRIFVDELGLDEAAFSDDLQYNAVPEWHSGSHMIIVLALEEAFGISLDPDEVVAITSVAKIYALLARKGVLVDA